MRVIYTIPTDLSVTGGHIQHVLGLCRHAHKFEIDLELFYIKSGIEQKFENFQTTAFEIENCSPQKRIITFCELALAEIRKRPRPDLIYFRPFPLDYYLFTRHLISQNLPYAYELNTLWKDELISQGKTIKAHLYPWFEAQTIKHASILFPVTQEIADYASSVTKKNLPTLVAGNGIEVPDLPLDSRDEIRSKWKLPLDKKLIVMAGFTRPWHGYEKLIKAIPLLPSNFHLVLVGSESEHITERAMKLAAELKIQSRLQILPWLSHLEVDEVVYACDIGVSPLALEKKKMKEAQSLKVRHYLAMGVPVLLAGGESNEVLSSGYIYHLPETSPDNIKLGILKLTELKPVREEIRSYAKMHLSWEAIASKTFQFIKDKKLLK